MTQQPNFPLLAKTARNGAPRAWLFNDKQRRRTKLALSAAEGNVRPTQFLPLLRRGVVVIADHAGDLPGSIFVLPQMNELTFANSDGVFVAGMVKAVNPDFERAVSLHVIDLQRPGNEFARGGATNVFLYAFGEGRVAKRDSALIVIKLHAVGDEGRKLRQVAVVVGGEQSRIERGDGLVEFRLIGDFVERQDFLGVGQAD